MAPDAGGAVATQDLAHGPARRFIESLPVDVRSSLTERQRDALATAAKSFAGSRHATDIRLSIPLFTKRYYLVLLGGEERRSRMRLAEDRGRFPLATAGNLVCLSLLGLFSTFAGGFLFTLLLVWYLSL